MKATKILTVLSGVLTVVSFLVEMKKEADSLENLKSELKEEILQDLKGGN